MKKENVLRTRARCVVVKRAMLPPMLDTIAKKQNTQRIECSCTGSAQHEANRENFYDKINKTHGYPSVEVLI